jgi:hypothetical protein
MSNDPACSAADVKLSLVGSVLAGKEMGNVVEKVVCCLARRCCGMIESLAVTFERNVFVAG